MLHIYEFVLNDMLNNTLNFVSFLIPVEIQNGYCGYVIDLELLCVG